MLRVVLDANVFVSALLSPAGAPAQVLASWEAGEFDLLTSPAILEELDRVLHYPRLRERYRLPAEAIQLLLRLLRTQSTVVTPEETLHVVENDPADNRYLECAVAGGAHIIVSGDGHLLALGEYEGVQILPPAGFVALLKLGE